MGENISGMGTIEGHDLADRERLRGFEGRHHGDAVELLNELDVNESRVIGLISDRADQLEAGRLLGDRDWLAARLERLKVLSILESGQQRIS